MNTPLLHINNINNLFPKNWDNNCVEIRIETCSISEIYYGALQLHCLSMIKII